MMVKARFGTTIPALPEDMPWHPLRTITND